MTMESMATTTPMKDMPSQAQRADRADVSAAAAGLHDKICVIGALMSMA